VCVCVFDLLTYIYTKKYETYRLIRGRKSRCRLPEQAPVPPIRSDWRNRWCRNRENPSR